MVLKLTPVRYGNLRPAESLRQYVGFFVNCDSTPTCQLLTIKGPVPIGLPVYVGTNDVGCAMYEICCSARVIGSVENGMTMLYVTVLSSTFTTEPMMG